MGPRYSGAYTDTGNLGGDAKVYNKHKKEKNMFSTSFSCGSVIYNV